MNQSRKNNVIAFALGFALISVTAAWGEHPTRVGEHPKAEHPRAEHPALIAGLIGQAYAAEHPTTMKELTLEDLEGITINYAKNKAGKDGYFSFYDPTMKKNMKLKLIKVHKEKLAKVAEGKYFICADFKRPDGFVHDLDMWVAQKTKGLRVYDVTVHKDSGKPRYNWVEKKGIWQRESAL